MIKVHLGEAPKIGDEVAIFVGEENTHYVLTEIVETFSFFFLHFSICKVK